MAKKKKAVQTTVNIKALALKSPKIFIQALKSSLGGLDVTKVIQTYILESGNLKISVSKDGKTEFNGKIKWIGNKNDDSQGIIICVESNKGLQMLSPSEETVQDMILDMEKDIIKIASIERIICTICNKGLRLTDEIMGCPLCNTKFHSEHLVEWVKYHHACSVCHKKLNLDQNNRPIPG
jgi:hypothetical protein